MESKPIEKDKVTAEICEVRRVPAQDRAPRRLTFEGRAEEAEPRMETEARGIQEAGGG